MWYHRNDFQNELGKTKEKLKINKNLSGQKNLNVEKANFGKCCIYWWCWVVGGLKLIAIKFCLKEDEAGDRRICSS